jgi:TRAP-type C4-dicarboxylate transport system permease small subunit
VKRLEAAAAATFGAVFVALSFAVAVETALRKAFNFSLQGVDELGGYALALGASLSFTVALVSRAHIRIDLIHDRLPRGARVALNALAACAISLVAALLVVMAWTALSDSIALNSTAQTPWATPLSRPQWVWLAALALFALVALAYVAQAAWLLARGRTDEMERRFSPKGAQEEVKEELEDIQARDAVGAAGLEARR